MNDRCKEYLPPGANPHALARAEETELGRILKHAFQVEIAKRREQYETNPKQNTEKVKDDFRCKIGEIIGLKFYEQLVQWGKEAVAETR